MQKLIHALMDRVRPGWRARKAKKQSSWHLLKFLCMYFFLFASFVTFYRLAELAFVEIFNTPLKEKYKVFVFLPLILPSIGVSLIFTNLCLFLIPPAKRAFEVEAKGDNEITFTGATTKLLSLTFKYLIPIGLGLSGIGMLMANA
jgi:hypothetical protein